MNAKTKELEDNINACYKASSEYSATLSSICRQMAFAEGALYWLLYTGFNLTPKYIIVGYLFLLVYFFTDLFQYLFGYIAYKKKADENIGCLKNKITKEESHLISDSDLYWVYKAMHLKLLFLAISSIIVILMFSFLLICGIK